MDKRAFVRIGLVLFISLGAILSGFSGVAAAETRTGGTVTVAEGETVDGLSVVSGTVVVRGTVDGDLEGAAGSIVIARSGVVTGDVSAAAGSLRIDGRVDGNINAGAGSVTVSQDGSVGGNLNSGSETVLIAGEIGGSAVLGAARVTLTETGSVGGDLRYSPDTQFDNQGGTVGGSVVADPSIGGGEFGVFSFPEWVFSGYFIVVNLALGALLLVLLPGFSSRVGNVVGEEPLRSAGAGLVTLFAVPAILVVLAISIVGIPLMLAGGFLFVLLLWIAVVYGRFAVAVWVLRQVDVDNRWLALVVGIIGIGLIGQIPLIGGLVTFATFLLGLGAVTLSVVRLRRGRGGGGTPESSIGSTGTDTPTAGS